LSAHRLAEGVDERRAASRADGPAGVGVEAADLGLDAVERGEARQQVVGDRRAGLGLGVEDLAPQMGEAQREGERRTALALRPGQAAIAPVAVDLQHPVEAREQPLGVMAAAAGRVGEDHARRVGAVPAAARRPAAPTPKERGSGDPRGGRSSRAIAHK